MTQQSVQRSQSRYHRNRPATAAASERQPPQPVPQSRTLHSTSRNWDVARQDSYDDLLDEYTEPPQRQRTTSGSSPAVRPPATTDARAEARQLMKSEAERQERMQAKIRADRKAQLEAQEAERRRQWEEEQAERQRMEAEELEQRQRLEAEALTRKRRDREEELAWRQRQREDEARRAWKEEEEQRMAGNRLKKKGSAGERLEDVRHGGTPQVVPVTPQKSTSGLFGMFKKRNNEARKSKELLIGPAFDKSPTSPDEKATFIKQGGGGVVPGTDAPISAVNAGDRRVKVECNNSAILLPVNPTTTPQELIRSASTCLSAPIDYSTAFLLESFIKVGLQRPLRKYEHVRDVLNSWDDDVSNSFLVMHATSAAAEAELSASSVPKDRPAFETGWYMYYSQKPGKWDKRYITLRADGQLTAAKNDAGKDFMNVCHLSDFDIYSPTPKKAKKIKPPKKICYAIKSQQKSTMFMNSTSFVHFFCSSDKRIADEFYRATQGWRSWYLVNIMGEGNKKKQVAEAASSPPRHGNSVDMGQRKISGSRDDSGHRPQGSMDSHYQLGSFKPMNLHESQFTTAPAVSSPTAYSPTRQPQPGARNVSASTAGSNAYPEDAPLGGLANAVTTTQHPRKMSVRNRAAPPSSFPGVALGYTANNNTSNRPSSSHSNHAPDQNPFAQNSLLGRTPSQRQRSGDQGNSGRRSSLDGGGGGLQRNASVRSQRHHSAEVPGRSNSIRGGKKDMPKPLVDLTPQYKEPPQFAKKGKGFRPENVGSGGLIDSATSGMQDAIVIPPSSDWRGRPATSGASLGAGGHDRTKSLKGHGVRVNGQQAIGGADPMGFTGKGLLASSGPGWGDGDKGRGIVSERARRGGPMLDLSEDSKFAQGSLLAKVEGTGGGNGYEH